MRSGKWKYHLPLERTYPAWDNKTRTGRGRPGKLVNLDEDLKESSDVSRDHPDILARLKSLAQTAMAELGTPEQRGSAQRMPHDVDSPVSQTLRQR